MARDLEAGGPVAGLVGAWPGSPRKAAVALRLCGALHFAASTGRDPALAAEYPATRPDFRIERVWAAARAFVAREHAWVADFVRSPPQTNEVRRSIALLPGFLDFAHAHERPLELLELGASAGLNLHWDGFHYRTETWSWGRESRVEVDSAWQGPPPRLRAQPLIRTRAGCDLNPLDLADPLQRARLRSYIWADQQARLARFDAAVELALEKGVRVERANAAEWLAARLARRVAGTATLIYHSVFLQYPPKSTRRALEDTIVEAGARATADAPLGWLRLEPEAILGGPSDSLRFLVELVTWPGAVRRVLAETDGHARGVRMYEAAGP